MAAVKERLQSLLLSTSRHCGSCAYAVWLVLVDPTRCAHFGLALYVMSITCHAYGCALMMRVASLPMASSDATSGSGDLSPSKGS